MTTTIITYVAKFSLCIGVIYKPERTNLNTVVDIYSGQLQKMKRAVVFGDFNFDLLQSNHATRQYKKLYKENHYKIINKINEQSCTRETSTTKTILDHISSNLKTNNFHIAVIESAMSDHKHIYCDIKNCHPVLPKRITYSKINYETLYKNYEQNQRETKDSLYEALEHKLIKCLSMSKTECTKVLNKPRNDWINREIMQGINKRNVLWHNYKKDMLCKEKEQLYMEEKKKINLVIQKNKSTYFKKRFQESVIKPRKMWKLITELSQNSIKDPSHPHKLIVASKIIQDAKEICDSLNNYFSQIGVKLANEFPDQYHCHQIQAKTHRSPELNVRTPTTSEEIAKIIDGLDTNTSCGIDGINTKSLKCVKKLMSADLALSINECLKHGIFPDSLKIAKVSPIYKSGSKCCNFKFF